MTIIETKVVRNGKWVSISDTKPIIGELCIEISDGYGWQAYDLTIISTRGTRVNMYDDDKTLKLEEEFNKIVTEAGLPRYFK